MDLLLRDWIEKKKLSQHRLNIKGKVAGVEFRKEGHADCLPEYEWNHNY